MEALAIGDVGELGEQREVVYEVVEVFAEVKVTAAVRKVEQRRSL